MWKAGTLGDCTFSASLDTDPPQASRWRRLSGIFHVISPGDRVAGPPGERSPGNEPLRDGVSSWGRGLVPRGRAAMGSQSPQKPAGAHGFSLSHCV